MTSCAGTMQQNGSAPPWLKQVPARAAAPTVPQQQQQQSSLKQPVTAGKQAGKIGFFIKPQVPKSRLGQAAAPAYVKVEDAKPAQPQVGSLCLDSKLFSHAMSPAPLLYQSLYIRCA